MMVFISLQISCMFENIEQIKTGFNYSYFLKLRCNNCGESDDIWHDICEEVLNIKSTFWNIFIIITLGFNKTRVYLFNLKERTKQDTRNAKGYNMVIKCKMCSRENSIDIVEDSTDVYDEKDTGKFKSIVTFDCRGIEPIDFDPREGFVVKSCNNGRCYRYFNIIYLL